MLSYFSVWLFGLVGVSQAAGMDSFFGELCWMGAGDRTSPATILKNRLQVVSGSLVLVHRSP